MFDNPIILLGVSTFFAAIPVGVWLYILFTKTEKSRKTVALVFFIGCFTAPALLGLQFLWEKFPRFDLATFIESSITTQSTMYIAMFMLFAAMEEIIKHYVVSSVDRKTLYINKVDDAIRYSLAAALGFSFTENIYYLYEFWPSISTGELVQMYIFRSIFTACAHMIFSGIFGYYYGIGKFSIQIRKQEEIAGKSNTLNRILGNIFSIPLSQAYQQRMVLKGLGIAITLHVIYNYLLQYNIILPVLIFVILGFIYLQYLLSRKAGHLVMTSDISAESKSTLVKKDEDVVLELLGLWFNDKRYVDVIHICERLLQRDPDNKVVQLFKAKALDKMDMKDHYREIIGTVIKTHDDLSEKDKSVITKYSEQKKKEGKSNPVQKKIAPEQEKGKIQEGDVLDKYTGGESFQMKL